MYRLNENKLQKGNIEEVFSENSFSGEDCYLYIETFSHEIDFSKNLKEEIEIALKSKSIVTSDYIGDSLEVSSPWSYLRSLGFHYKIETIIKLKENPELTYKDIERNTIALLKDNNLPVVEVIYIGDYNEDTIREIKILEPYDIIEGDLNRYNTPDGNMVLLNEDEYQEFDKLVKKQYGEIYHVTVDGWLNVLDEKTEKPVYNLLNKDKIINNMKDLKEECEKIENDYHVSSVSEINSLNDKNIDEKFTNLLNQFNQKVNKELEGKELLVKNQPSMIYPPAPTSLLYDIFYDLDDYLSFFNEFKEPCLTFEEVNENKKENDKYSLEDYIIFYYPIGILYDAVFEKDYLIFKDLKTKKWSSDLKVLERDLKQFISFEDQSFESTVNNILEDDFYCITFAQQQFTSEKEIIKDLNDNYL